MKRRLPQSTEERSRRLYRFQMCITRRTRISVGVYVVEGMIRFTSSYYVGGWLDPLKGYIAGAFTHRDIDTNDK